MSREKREEAMSKEQVKELAEKLREHCNSPKNDNCVGIFGDEICWECLAKAVINSRPSSPLPMKVIGEKDLKNPDEMVEIETDIVGEVSRLYLFRVAKDEGFLNDQLAADQQVKTNEGRQEVCDWLYNHTEYLSKAGGNAFMNQAREWGITYP